MKFFFPHRFLSPCSHVLLCLFMGLCLGCNGEVAPRSSAQVINHPEQLIGGSGGAGARPGKDGLSATAFPSGVRNVPVEVTEAISPLIVWRKEYRLDSGGAGEYRGGLGQTMELGLLQDAPFAFSALFDRIDYPPRGRDGGDNGGEGAIYLASGSRLNGKGTQTIPRGERVVVDMPGGGGLGEARMRDPRRVVDDVRGGLVSKDVARSTYRVAIDDNGYVDEKVTQKLRAN